MIDLTREGFFSRGDTTLFRSITDGLMNCDTYMLFADFQSYVDCQTQVAHAYQNARHWSRMFDPQRSPLRPLLLGPHDSRIRRRNLARLPRLA